MQFEIPDQTTKFKIIVIGEPGSNDILRFKGAGKSCLINKYVKKEFLNDYEMTIGIEF